MLHEGQPIGAITVTGAEAGAFSQWQIELLKTFADQAVIAIENVRLFRKLESRTGELARSVEELQAPGDGGRITQCLMNLAGNALKFTRRGRVGISADLQGDLLVYRVADTGIGIAKNKIESLFTEFRQGDATIASEFGGTGLGLSITKKFVEMHRGRISVQSDLGKGSTFFLSIPLRLDGGKAA
jgi:signal transduction histidine kinase